LVGREEGCDVGFVDKEGKFVGNLVDGWELGAIVMVGPEVGILDTVGSIVGMLEIVGSLVGDAEGAAPHSTISAHGTQTSVSL
jgi:hypothetical protein